MLGGLPCVPAKGGGVACHSQKLQTCIKTCELLNISQFIALQKITGYFASNPCSLCEQKLLTFGRALRPLPKGITSLHGVTNEESSLEPTILYVRHWVQVWYSYDLEVIVVASGGGGQDRNRGSNEKKGFAWCNTSKSMTKAQFWNELKFMLFMYGPDIYWTPKQILPLRVDSSNFDSSHFEKENHYQQVIIDKECMFTYTKKKILIPTGSQSQRISELVE